jgi:hypothetical protein
MFNYKLVVEDGKGNKVTEFKLAVGESKKGTFATLSGEPANKALPFGKLYADESLIKAKKADKPAPVAPPVKK